MTLIAGVRYQDWSYDGAGNQLQNAITGQTSTVDDRGGVTAIGSSTYTAWGVGNTRTLSRTVGTEVAGFMNSPTGLMSGTTWNVNTRAYARTPHGRLTGLRYYTARYYYAMDALGSVVGIFAKDGSYEGGYSYSPYGEETESTKPSAVPRQPSFAPASASRSLPVSTRRFRPAGTNLSEDERVDRKRGRLGFFIAGGTLCIVVGVGILLFSPDLSRHIGRLPVPGWATAIVCICIGVIGSACAWFLAIKRR